MADHSLTFDQLREDYSSWSLSGNLPETLLAYAEQQVMIRGFLYSAGDETWILASEPNLKSCCVGASSKRGLQLTVTGSLPKEPPITALLVQGTLKVTPESLKSFYALEQAFIVEEPFSLSLFWGVALVCACFLSIRYFWKRSRAR